MSRPEALLLAPEAPYPMVGGAIRTASLAEYLARRYTLDVVVFREPEAPDPRAAFPPGLAREIAVIELPFHSNRGAARGWRNLVRCVRGRPPLSDRFAGFGGRLEELLRGRRYKLAVVEHSWCAPYAEQLAGHAELLVLDLHNIESVLHRRAASSQGWAVAAAFRRFARAWQELERRWLPRYGLLLAASAEDARLARELAPGCRCEVYPNSLPLVAAPVRAEEHVVVFSGNFDYHPNIAAVRFFRARIWPALRERFPDLRWRLVGRHAEGARKWVAGDGRIELTGAVEDAVSELAAAQVVVVPLLAGSGTRFKIIEAWAAARAVVSTSVGAEGLPGVCGEHLVVADEPEGFAAAVARLLESEEEGRRLGRAGRGLYERELTWEAAWRRLEKAGI